MMHGIHVHDVYLQWCAGEQESVRGMVVLIQHLGQLAVVVLHAVTLINDHVLPANLNTHMYIHVFIRCTMRCEIWAQPAELPR